MFYFHPYLGKWSNLFDIFQMGWNHQLGIYFQNNLRLVKFWQFGQIFEDDDVVRFLFGDDMFISLEGLTFFGHSVNPTLQSLVEYVIFLEGLNPTLQTVSLQSLDWNIPTDARDSMTGLMSKPCGFDEEFVFFCVCALLGGLVGLVGNIWGFHLNQIRFIDKHMSNICVPTWCRNENLQKPWCISKNS